MVQPRVIDVGNCAPDFSSIKRMLESQFQATVVQANGAADALKLAKSQSTNLVLINRKLDMDYSDGTDVLKQFKADPETRDIPVMLTTNYAEHQQAAIELGAVEGFGKLSIGEPATIAKLSPYLEP